MDNFSWLVDGEIAGSAHPAHPGQEGQEELEVRLKTLSAEGIGAIVTLSEIALNRELLDQLGFRYLHLPVQDMAAPTIEDVVEFIAFTHQVRQRNVGILVHCLAGMGRTGTMLACYLLHEGRSCDQAIDEVRRRRPGSIETLAQETLVRQYSDWIENSIPPRICAN